MSKRLRSPANETDLIEFGSINPTHLSKQIALCKPVLSRAPRSVLQEALELIQYVGNGKLNKVGRLRFWS